MKHLVGRTQVRHVHFAGSRVGVTRARESLRTGAAFLLRGRARDAEDIFREDLRINPGSGRALFGLWKVLAAQGRSSEERITERQFREAWKNADTILSLEGL